MDEAYVGAIVMFAGNFAPRGWMLCQGQSLSIAQNQALYAILGTTYGGDGTTTFKLPNLCGRVPVGAGQSPASGVTYTAGQASGVETVTLTQAQMPQHVHQLSATGMTLDTSKLTVDTSGLNATVKLGANNGSGTTNNPAGAYIAVADGDTGQGDTVTTKGFAPTANVLLAAPTVTIGGSATIGGTAALSGTPTVQPAGGSQPFGIMQPYLGINYIICLQGVFPTRA